MRGVNATLSVRLFEDDDAARLTELLHRAYAELGDMGLNYTAVDQDVATTMRRARGGQCWIVERASQIVGSLTMSMPPADGLKALTAAAREQDCAWLNQLAVSPSERGHGIAADLWRRGRRWAVARGVTLVGIDTAAPAQHLVQLYVSWGFSPVDTIHWPGKTYDSVVMTRPVSREDLRTW